jgi:2-desacetyl-2-hydroxyethyl bacteriochlorophyllide A dehydrogenase
MADRFPSHGPALLVTGPGQVEMTDRAVVDPAPRHVLVKTEFSGISVGTELAAANGRYPVWGPFPFVPGYQAVGRVIATGPGVEGPIEIGDAVAAFSTSGTHAAYVSAPIETVHRLPPGAARDECALFVQPSVALNALNRAGVRAGHTVYVAGQGLIGQTAAALARLRGADLAVSDRSPERLAIARRHTADEVVDASHGAPWEQPSPRHPDGFDVVTESTGLVAVIDDTLACVRPDGAAIFLGFYPDGFGFTYHYAHEKQVTAFFPSFIGAPPVEIGSTAP